MHDKLRLEASRKTRENTLINKDFLSHYPVSLATQSSSTYRYLKQMIVLFGPCEITRIGKELRGVKQSQGETV